MTDTEHPLAPKVRAALRQVQDPELRRPITDLGMVDSVQIDGSGFVAVKVLLTTAGCPLRVRITADVEEVVGAVEGVTGVAVELGVMDDEQRGALRSVLSGGSPVHENPFARADSLTRVIAVASGKGGVGKSSVTANLACALAGLGLNVGLLDADVYGHSIPDLLGVPEGEGPTQVEGVDIIIPLEIQGLKVMSIGMMKPDREQVVAWRGPIVSRSVEQFLTDVYWGDLDFLLIDLPPGTGDVALSIGQSLPNSEVVVVTTPQQAATEVAERAGTMASLMHQKIIGVVENMSHLMVECPDCGRSQRVDVFGSGGGARVAESLTRRLGYDVPLLAEIPLDLDWRAAGDAGTPLVTLNSSRPSAAAVSGLAQRLAATKRGLAGRRLDLNPA
ncbi:MAG: Mrp/NBP35 family ATP-binding protein [Propionibacteriaceae bacterium]|nr:Mrp/NBP35 family ATP-binding protein [Propionibacteriaceae bacterium]